MWCIISVGKRRKAGQDMGDSWWCVTYRIKSNEKGKKMKARKSKNVMYGEVGSTVTLNPEQMKNLKAHPLQDKNRAPTPEFLYAIGLDGVLVDGVMTATGMVVDGNCRRLAAIHHNKPMRWRIIDPKNDVFGAVNVYNQLKKESIYQSIRALIKQGISQREIARRLAGDLSSAYGAGSGEIDPAERFKGTISRLCKLAASGAEHLPKPGTGERKHKSKDEVKVEGKGEPIGESVPLTLKALAAEAGKAGHPQLAVLINGLVEMVGSKTVDRASLARLAAMIK